MSDSTTHPSSPWKKRLSPNWPDSFGQRVFLAVSLLLTAGVGARSIAAQALPTATRAGDLQIGGTFSLAKPDYTTDTFKGFGFYTTFDFKEHFGIDAEFHQVNRPSPSAIYERTYEVGGRYVRHYNIFNPYVKLLYGRGVFNYEADVANLAYNMGNAGVGVDVNLTRRLNVRADYEYQQWFNFRGFVSGNSVNNNSSTLSPQVFTIGAAYHFQ